MKFVDCIFNKQVAQYLRKIHLIAVIWSLEHFPDDILKTGVLFPQSFFSWANLGDSLGQLW